MPTVVVEAEGPEPVEPRDRSDPVQVSIVDVVVDLAARRAEPSGVERCAAPLVGERPAALVSRPR